MNLITDIPNRKTTSLNGKWQYIADPYETGFYDYCYEEMRESDAGHIGTMMNPKNKTNCKECGYIDKYTLNLPGDWNSQDAKFLYYERTIWYKKSFDFTKSNVSEKLFLYFGAVNHSTNVYLMVKI